MPICGKNETKNSLRGVWGTGSRSTDKRARRTQRQLKIAASQSYSIAGLFERQRDLQLSIRDSSTSNDVISRACSPSHTSENVVPRACSLPRTSENGASSLSAIPRACSPPRNMEEIRKTASARMDRLLKLSTVQKDMYGIVLDPRSSFHLRHRMVQSFLWLQGKRNQFPDKTQRQLAFITANSFNRGSHTARMIVQWANIWTQGEKLPNTHAGQHNHNFSWMDDEDVTFAVREFIHQQGESEYSNPYFFCF